VLNTTWAKCLLAMSGNVTVHPVGIWTLDIQNRWPSFTTWATNAKSNFKL